MVGCNLKNTEFATVVQNNYCTHNPLNGEIMKKNQARLFNVVEEPNSPLKKTEISKFKKCSAVDGWANSSFKLLLLVRKPPNYYVFIAY